MNLEQVKEKALNYGWSDVIVIPNGKFVLMFNDSPRKVGTLKVISAHIDKYPRLFIDK